MLEAYYAAWGHGDPDAIAAYFTPDAVFEDVAFDARFEGPEGVRDFARLTFQGVPDFQIAPERITVDGEDAAAWWTMSGTHAGDMPGFPATGRRFEISASSMIRLRDGKIQRMTDYWEPSELR